jgi:hypothetical protein
MDLSMPATFHDAMQMQAVATENDFIEVNGDAKAVILWTVHSDGTKSILDLYYWA